MNSIKMAFERRFNAIRFYSKLNHFVLSPRKKPNHFVLKIRPGGFADYRTNNRHCSLIVPLSWLKVVAVIAGAVVG